MGKGLALSRLGGGIGTRGPGETKLEVDRRRIRDRIAYIKECIGKVKSVRTLHRAGRAKASAPTVSLVGYTNAGKSTLLNTLTNSDIYAQDQLFATLDPTTRQLDLPNKQQAIFDRYRRLYPTLAASACCSLPVYAGGGCAVRRAAARYRCQP